MGTYHSNRPDVIESDDIIELLGVTLAEEDGNKVAVLKVALDPAKTFEAGPDGVYLHQTNGVQPRMLGPVVPEIADPAPEPVTFEAVAVPPTEVTAPSGESGEGGDQSKSSASSKGKGK